MEFFCYEEGLCVQCMHVGPYDTEPETIRQMETYAAEQGISQTLQYSVSITRSTSVTQGVLHLKKCAPGPRSSGAQGGMCALNRCCEQRHMHGKRGGTCELPLKKATKSVAFSCEMCYTILRSIRLSG